MKVLRWLAVVLTVLLALALLVVGSALVAGRAERTLNGAGSEVVRIEESAWRRG